MASVHSSWFDRRARADTRAVSSAVLDAGRLRRARVAVSLAFLTLGAQLGVWFAHIPHVAKRLALDPALLGLGTLTIGVVGLLTQSVAGVAIARFGARRTTTILLPAFVLMETALINTPSRPLF